MPCIKIIDSIKLYIYQRDHNPPHFHAIHSEFEELIEIKTLATYSGSIPTKQRKKVIAWAEKNQAFLMNKWEELNERN